jgi:hypothetical protein
MDHRITSIKFIAATGMHPVKVRPGQKDPFPEWNPKAIHLQDDQLVLAEIQRDTSLNVASLFAGRYVDVDVDSTSPYLHAALDYFLPRTPYVWGRESKRRSHRVYALHEDFDRAVWSSTTRYLKGLIKGQVDDESYSVEVRGGKPENALYSVLPGSTHPSGESIEWDHEIDPTVGGAYVETHVLMKAIRLAVASAMLAPHWVEGVRNDMSLALAGTLWRIRTSTRAAYGLEPNEDVEDPTVFVLNEDDAKSIFNCVMTIAGDNEEDRRSRLLNLKNTWSKLDGEVGAKVTGGKVLASLTGDADGVGARMVRALYRLLSDNDAAEQIEQLAEQFVMWYGPGVLIDLKMVVRGSHIPWMNFIQAKSSMGGKNIVIGSSKIKMVDMLFNTSIINRVMGLTFDPGVQDLLVHTPEGLMVNQWRGFAVQPSPQRVTPEEVEPFTDYLHTIVCNRCDEHYEWVMAWLADIFQYPSHKPGTALVLVGVQGAGKTFLGEHVIGKIIGASHYAQLKDVTKLTDRFNTIIDNKLFVQCDEAIHSYQRDVASRLKSVISDGTMLIEPKGVNAYPKPSHFRLLFTSNEETGALFIDPSPYERRFTVLKVNAERARDLDYWVKLREWMPGALPKVMRYLMDWKYDRRLVSRPVATQAKMAIQKVGMDVEMAWILSRMASGFPFAARAHTHWFNGYHSEFLLEKDKSSDVIRRDHWPDRVQLSLIEQDFKDYVRGLGRAIYSGNLMQAIKKVLPPGSYDLATQTSVRVVDHRTGQATVERVRIYHWPSVEKIFDHLRAEYGSIVEEMWDEVRKEAIAPPAIEEKEEF